jgi:hypothetical protein
MNKIQFSMRIQRHEQIACEAMEDPQTLVLSAPHTPPHVIDKSLCVGSSWDVVLYVFENKFLNAEIYTMI